MRAGILIPPPSPGWQAGLAATTGIVFVAVVSIPVPLFGPGNGTATAVSPASVTYYHGDHLGSSVVLTSDSSGANLLRHVIYRPFGGVVAETPGGSSEPPEVGFTGQRFEKSAALYDYGARWYDPQFGRFLQPDPIVPEPFNPQSLNRYSYVMNDPVNRIDPTGNSFYFVGASTYSGTISSTAYGYDIYIGAGTRYSSSGGASSSAQGQSTVYREDRPQAQQSSGITAESFTFSLTLPAQPVGVGSGRGSIGPPMFMNSAGIGTHIREFGLVEGLRQSLLSSAFILRGQAEQVDLLNAETYGQLGNLRFRDEMLRGAAIRELLANLSPTRDLVAPTLGGAILGKGAAAVGRTPFAQAAFLEFTNNVTLGFGAGQALSRGTGPIGLTPAARLGFELGFAAGLSQSRAGGAVRMLLGGT